MEPFSVEDEQHLVSCKSLMEDGQEDITFSDVYGGVDQQLKAVKIFKKIERKMKVLLEIGDKSVL